MRRALLGVGLAVAVGAAAADLATLRATFDHPAHARAFSRAGVTCVDCHPVGARSGTIESDRAACHVCHAPGAGGIGAGEGLRGAPDRCDLCHAVVAPPASHAAGWLELHGADARADGDGCRTCHDRSSCVDCHDRRQNGAFAVHDPSWIRTHGIAVRANPAACDGCHARSECLACHASAAGFGRTR